METFNCPTCGDITCGSREPHQEECLECSDKPNGGARERATEQWLAYIQKVNKKK